MDTYIDEYNKFHISNGQEKQLDALYKAKEEITRTDTSREVLYGDIGYSHRYKTYSMPSSMLFDPMRTITIPQRNVLQ